MAGWDRTWRDVDGLRIEGVWRHAFIRNGDTYYLTDLKIYADGKVDCWGLVGFEEFCDKVRTGWVATEFEDGARAAAHGVCSWRMSRPVSHVDAEQLLLEVADEMAQLSGRPTSRRRCLDALRAFAAEPTETRRQALESAYLAVPRHMRIFLLGDQDAKDYPLRVVLAKPGQPLFGDSTGTGRTVSEGDRDEALRYFRESTVQSSPEAVAAWEDPERAPAQRDVVPFTGGGAWVGVDPALSWLSPPSPHPVVIDGTEWPSVAHAYWAMSTSEPGASDLLRAMADQHEVRRRALEFPRQPNWPQRRVAVMHRLLRAKFHQHPELAQRLLATGDAALVEHSGMNGSFWDGAPGQNWVGRLLELVRAELAEEAAAC